MVPMTPTDTVTSQVLSELLRTSQPPESERTAHFNADLLEYLSAVSLGADPDVLPLHRYLPVEIYMARDVAEVEGYLFLAITGLIEDKDFRRVFEIHSVGPSEVGSFRLTFVLRSLERLTLQGVHQVVEGIKVACESRLKSPGEEDKPAILIDAQIEAAKAQAEGAKKLQEAQIKLANVQTCLAVAGFFVSMLGTGVAGYIQLAHLQAEKPTPGSTINLYITPASRAFTVPQHQTSPGAPSAGRQEI
jgi:hypothetical protein